MMTSTVWCRLYFHAGHVGESSCSQSPICHRYGTGILSFERLDSPKFFCSKSWYKFTHQTRTSGIKLQVANDLYGTGILSFERLDSPNFFCSKFWYKFTHQTRTSGIKLQVANDQQTSKGQVLNLKDIFKKMSSCFVLAVFVLLLLWRPTNSCKFILPIAICKRFEGPRSKVTPIWPQCMPQFYCPVYGAFDLGFAVSVPLPIVTGIFVLLWFQSRLT